MTVLELKQKQDLIKQIDKVLNDTSIKSLSNEELQFITKHLIVDKLKEEINLEIKKSKTNVNKLKLNWLSLFDSEATKASYSLNIQQFIDWVEKRKVHFLNLKAKDFNDYLLYLRNKNLKANSIRLKIAAVSSFFTYLKRNEIVKDNYCKNIYNLPKKRLEIKSHDEIPNKYDISIIENELWFDYYNVRGKGYVGKIKSARTGLIILAFIKRYALRIGAFKELTIDRKGYFKTISKGKVITGKLDEEIKALLNKLNVTSNKPFENITTTNLKIWFQRFNKRLYKQGKLHTVYSWHDIRHYSAIQFFQKSKNIYELKKFLKHESIQTTQTYLSSLQIDI